MTEWWRGAVIYQIYPRSFQDSNGDGVGDLPGIVERLEHVARLGADAVWLSPIFPSPMADMGYDVSDYTGVDPLFGTLADFDRLVGRAHALGLKVVIDQVLSHTSDQHVWFKESRADRDNPRADWYVWADPRPDGGPPNNWASVFGGPAWEWDTRRRQYYLHNFLASQPDLNFHTPAVQDAVLEVLRFWLERGVDGFRFDTVNYYFHDRKLRPNPPAARDAALPPVNPYEMQEHLRDKTQPENVGFLKRIRTLMDHYEARTTVGEVGESGARAIEIMADYTRGAKRLHMAYSFELLGAPFTARHFRKAVERFYKAAPDGCPCWSFSNHDVIRHASRWLPHAADADALARQAAALLLSLQGSVCLYQGEELGLPESELELEELTDPPGIRFWPEYKGRDGCRTPMPWDGESANAGFSAGKPWLPVKAPQAARHVAGQEADPGSVLAFYRRMLAFRRSRPELVGGGTRFFRADEPVLAFLRQGEGSGLACVFNLSAETRAVRVKGLALSADDPSQAAGLLDRTLTLGANGFAFLAPTGEGEPRVSYRG
ncbi:alpha-glucosidase [Amaricoccus sp.]|uniref:alpha-glucosidase n=1 Tax=Amaricoccus sp. TaxID=1872485 RepID=UPI001B77FE14|nr:alpha-glucosidase [Amaricoccus sp.]MBP7001868.1 alpha glucosidase [Amaricoccus sp.]